jgi:hypothetical protein
MRRASPYRGENPGPGEDVDGELDPTAGIRTAKTHLRHEICVLLRCTPQTLQTRSPFVTTFLTYSLRQRVLE